MVSGSPLLRLFEASCIFSEMLFYVSMHLSQGSGKFWKAIHLPLVSLYIFLDLWHFEGNP